MDLSRLSRLAVRLGFALYLAGVLLWLSLGLIPVHVTHPDLSHVMLDATTGLETAVQYAFSVLNLGLGIVLLVRRPDELVPRLLALALLGTAATFNLPSHQAFHITGSPWPIALLHFSFHVISGVAYVWAVVLFPDGRLPRGRLSAERLRVLGFVSTGAVALVCWRSSFLDHPQFFIIFFGIAVALVGVGAQSLRILDQRTTPRDRASARLLCGALLPALAAALVWLVARGAVLLWGSDGPAGMIQIAVERLFPAVFAIVPVVLCAAVVRYRLWDIDRLLSRALVYAFLALVLGAAYVLAVAAGGWLAGGGLWLTAFTLSAAAVLVEPLHTAGRRWANRVVFGQTLSPTEALRSLAGSLEHLAPAQELDHVVSVAAAATRASSSELWLLDGGRLVLAARTPQHSGPRPGLESAVSGNGVPVGVDGVPVGVDATPAALLGAVGASHGWPIRHQGRLLGLLCAEAPAGARLTAADDSLGADIAAHAALIVHNAALTMTLSRQVDELAAQAEQLAASRRRLVAAQDEERRALERALHDGAQQALVAAIIGARACAGQAPVTVEEADELRQVLLIAQRDVDELSGDGRPGRLRRLGLRGALAEVAELLRRTGVTVVLDLDCELQGALEREPRRGLESASGGHLTVLPDEVETAIYFSCVEGLQNVAKYARAHTAKVRVRRTADEVEFAVVDDGVGFEPRLDAAAGGAVAGLARRLAPLGGQIVVEPGTDGGTVLRGLLPLGRSVGVPP